MCRNNHIQTISLMHLVLRIDKTVERPLEPVDLNQNKKNC